MTLRTTAIIAGVIGLLMLVAGLLADGARADREVVTTAQVESPVVVLPPEVLTLEGLERLAVTADGRISAHAARPVDADAWLKVHSAAYVVGYAGWDDLTLRTESRVLLESPSPSPSPAATASAAPTPTPSPSPSPSASTDADESASDVSADFGSADHWRRTWNGTGRLSLAIPALTPGEYLVVHSDSGEDLGTVEFTAQRQVNDGWISPLIWIGAGLSALGVVAALSGLVDVRPLQERLEGAKRRRAAAGAGVMPEPGSRRERRLAGSTLPAVNIDEDALASGTPLTAPVTEARISEQSEADDTTTDDAEKGGAR